MFLHYKATLFFTLLSILFLTACATKIAKPIDEKLDSIPNANTVSQNIDAYIGQRIRWGGIVADVVNEKATTVIEIVTRPLDRQGRPGKSDVTYGRFFARIEGFLDPMVYTKGREVTVVGTISGQRSALIGLYEYQYTEVNVDTYKLWPLIEQNQDYLYDPYWYGPWYRGYPRPPYYYYPWWY